MKIMQKVAATFGQVFGLFMGEGIKTASEKTKRDYPTYPNMC